MFIKLSLMDDYAWRDVFESLSPTDDRKKVALISKFGDCKFSNICQKWLHEWTKNIRIDTLRIERKCGELIVENGEWDQIALADTELPANICDFRQIRIEYLNSEVIRFLHRMEPLLRGVNLFVKCNTEKPLEDTRTTLGHVLPLLAGGIETVYLQSEQLLTAVRDHLPTQQFFGIKHFELLVGKPSADDATTDNLVELLRQWLGTRLENGQPKIARLSSFSKEGIPLVLGLLERIRQHFPNETNQASFFIRVFAYPNCLHTIQESTTQNAGTNEQLLFRKYFSRKLLIGRCPSELDGREWMKEMNSKMNVTRRLITVDWTTVGQIEEARLEEERKDDDDVHQPGPSRN